MELIQGQYKDTKIGRIPKDWEVVTLSDISKKTNQGVNTTTEKVKYSDEGNYQVIRSNNLSDNFIDWNNSVFIDDNTFDRISENVKPNFNDILYSNIGSALGFAAVVTENIDFAIAWNVFRIQPFAMKINSSFLAYFLNFRRKHIRRLETQSTMPFISSKIMLKLQVAKPSLLEQQKIVEILSTVDEQISTTQAIIDKSKELKKGLMQKLFSEGIGHTEFKDTKIGRIPKDWGEAKLTDVIDLIHGHQFRDYDFVDNGIPIVKIGSLIDGKGISFDNATFVDVNKLNDFKQYLLKKGDVLMALTGATLGKVSKVDTKKTILQNYRVGKFVPKNSLINGLFLYHILQSHLVQTKMWALINQGAQPNIGKADFRLIQISLPPYKEQHKIADILSEADAKIEKEEQEKAKLKELKKGLMQQLLTGKKRVKV